MDRALSSPSNASNAERTTRLYPETQHRSGGGPQRALGIGARGPIDACSQRLRCWFGVVSSAAQSLRTSNVPLASEPLIEMARESVAIRLRECWRASADIAARTHSVHKVPHREYASDCVW